MLLTALIAGLFAVSAQAASPQRALLDRYCVTCHTEKAKERGAVPIALDHSDVSNPGTDPELWEKVIRKMRAGLMPPPGISRPDNASTANFVSSLEAQLDRAAEANPNAGKPLVHRLNRTEYANAIRDLLALEIDAASLLPPDDSAYGFDNISDALGFSPLLQERYVGAAMKIGALAVGDSRVSPSSETYRRIAAGNDRRNQCPTQFSVGRPVHVPGEALSNQSEYCARAGIAASGRIHDRRRTSSPCDDRRQ